MTFTKTIVDEAFSADWTGMMTNAHSKCIVLVHLICLNSQLIQDKYSKLAVASCEAQGWFHCACVIVSICLHAFLHVCVCECLVGCSLTQTYVAWHISRTTCFDGVDFSSSQPLLGSDLDVLLSTLYHNNIIPLSTYIPYHLHMCCAHWYYHA